MTNFKKGLAYLIQRNPSIKVIPVYLNNIYKTLPKGRKLIIPYNCSIEFGEPIQFRSFELDDILNDSEIALKKLIK